MRTQPFSTNEQYWRDRYGMPPRVEGHELPRLRPAARRALSRRARQSVVFWQRFRAVRYRRTFARESLLKFTAAVFLAIWLAGSGIVLLRGAPEQMSADGKPAFIEHALSDRELTALPRKEDGIAGYDGLMADFAAANEASLVALRGYLLTGSEGFKEEWLKATARFETAAAAIEDDSRLWTDGRKLVQLGEVRRVSAELLTQQRTLASLVGTSNRFPGLRLYGEDVDPALVQAVVLCDETLQSMLMSRWSAAAGSVDTLARVRGAIRAVRGDLALYLGSSDVVGPESFRANYRDFRAARDAIASLRGKVAPADQAKLDRLSALLGNADRQLQQILALKRTPRWDYADYAFKQRVLPLAERISAVIGEWRSAS